MRTNAILDKTFKSKTIRSARARKIISNTFLVFLASTIIAACNQLSATIPLQTATQMPAIEHTYTPEVPTKMATNLPTETATLKPATTNSPTPTEISYQILGRIFPEGFNSAGVSANINTGNLDSRNTHYDVAIPRECRANSLNCPVISPVEGKVWEIYGLGDPKGTGGYVISINLDQPPEGIEEVLEHLNINPDDVYEYSIHLGHLVGLNPDLDVGDRVDKGILLSNGVNQDPEPKVAYVLYIKTNQAWFQISPCSVSNTSSFCGVCYQYIGDCPETDLNFPEGGIEWWNEDDPFWDTHQLSPP